MLIGNWGRYRHACEQDTNRDNSNRVSWIDFPKKHEYEVSRQEDGWEKYPMIIPSKIDKNPNDYSEVHR